MKIEKRYFFYAVVAAAAWLYVVLPTIEFVFRVAS